MIVDQKRRWMITMAVLLAVAVAGLAFKPKTHLASSVDASTSLREGLAAVEIDGRHYAVHPLVARAIQKHEAHYFAGVLGPDAFPDIVFGQSIIHPDSRCDNGRIPDQNCAVGAGATFTTEWMHHVYDEAWSRFAQTQDTSLIAFAYGFLTHAAGDMWAHTLVNYYSQGIFPGVGEIAADLARGRRDLLNIALRHIVIEGYIGKRTAGVPPAIAINPQFIHDVLIRHPEALRMAPGSHFQKILTLQSSLDGFRARLEERDLSCLIADITVPLSCQAMQEYLLQWSRDIDRGLAAWPSMSLRVARHMFIDEDVRAAILELESFKNTHVLSMLGAPDAVGYTLEQIADLSEYADTLIARAGLDVMKQFQDWVFRQMFGMTATEMADYYGDPDRHIRASGIGLHDSVRQRLDAFMGIEAGGTVHNDLTFAPYRNATITAKLLLLSPDELDSFLYDHHVGRIYGGRRLAGTPMATNAILGFIRSLDGNHQWRRKSPSDVPWGRRGHAGALAAWQRADTIGMPIWTDCLARSRVFRRIFRDWEGTNYPARGTQQFPEVDSDEQCRIVSDPLAPVDLFAYLPAPNVRYCTFPIWGRVNNHRDAVQQFSLYVRVSKAGWDQPGGRRVVFHRVVHDSVPALADVDTLIHTIACDNAGYAVEFFLFSRMNALPAESPLNRLIPPEAPLLPAPVQSPVSFGVILDRTVCPNNTTENECSDVIPGPRRTENRNLPFRFCTFEPGFQCDEGPLQWPALDVDDDSVPDSRDNCVLRPNRAQDDRNGFNDSDGIGDACEVVLSDDIYKALDEWGRGRIPDERAQAAMRGILQKYDLIPREPSIPPICPLAITCPRSAPTLRTSVALLAREGRAGRLDNFEVLTRFAQLYEGVRATIPTAQVRSADVTDGGRTIVFRLERAAVGEATVTLPGSIAEAIGAGKRPTARARIDGRVTRTKTTRTATGLTVTVPVSRNARELLVQFSP